MSIESQRAGASLPETEEHYRAVAEAATDAIITIDSDSTILVVNPATERIFGYSVGELIGQPLTKLFAGISTSSAQSWNHPLHGNGPEAHRVVSRSIARLA